MPFEQALHDLSMLLRLSAATLSRIAGQDPRFRDQLDLLAGDIDVIAERLMGIRCDMPPAADLGRHLHS